MCELGLEGVVVWYRRRFGEIGRFRGRCLFRFLVAGQAIEGFHDAPPGESQVGVVVGPRVFRDASACVS